MKTPVIFTAILWALLCLPSPAESYTYPQLVDRMTDMEALARLPVPGEKLGMASSYDRASKYDAVNDKYIGWDANGDGGGNLGKEGDQFVLMNVQGPGCIWRTWSATAALGHVKIYLDGATTPTVDLPFKGYFDGATAPFNRPNLVYIPSKAAHGFDNFTPMPFQHSCKIMADKGWGSYYEFTYSLFPEGTTVPTFSMDLSAEDSAALDRADKILGECGQDASVLPSNVKTETAPITVAAGATATVENLNGAGAIAALKVKLDLPDDPEAQRILLRQLTISITWDDETAPAVWSPLGDFFGYVGGADKFQSLPAGLLDDGTFYSYWYMPFGKKAHIEIGNDGPAPVAMTWQVSHVPLAEPIEKLARFHAKWHRDAFLPTRKDRAIDWTLLTTQGTGRYVGTHLHGWNPMGDWWGEGDDKFFIDGEKFPSIFGTGSEDYFGYAWSSFGHFSRPYHNQILNEGNAGHFDDNRWHIADSVPFQTSFEGDIEKYFQNDRPTLYAADAFWYLDAGGTDPYTAVPVTERVGYWVRPDVYKEPGAIEAENLLPPMTVRPPHNPSHQLMFKFGNFWSGAKQLFWPAVDVGESIEFNLPVQKAGTYQLKAHFGMGPDYGIYQLSLNGTDVGAPQNLYAPTISVGDVVDLGTVTLAEGRPVLKITLTGKDDKSKGSFFGLDYLKLIPAP